MGRMQYPGTKKAGRNESIQSKRGVRKITPIEPASCRSGGSRNCSQSCYVYFSACQRRCNKSTPDVACNSLGRLHLDIFAQQLGTSPCKHWRLVDLYIIYPPIDFASTRQ